jgi:hypothetical protein
MLPIRLLHRLGLKTPATCHQGSPMMISTCSIASRRTRGKSPPEFALQLGDDKGIETENRTETPM